MNVSEILRKIPSINKIIEELKNSEYKYLLENIPYSFVIYKIREYINELRNNIKNNNIKNICELKNNNIDILLLIKNIKKRIQKIEVPNICKVINGTGVILHTGLGRAVIPPKALENIRKELEGYSIVEIDKESGERNVRDENIKEYLKYLSQSEDATVVNNNAAAVLVVLSTLCKNKEVIISRGQLVEIGGSFRVPEVMEQSGAYLKEVGCTNKTYIKDYEKAINSKTSAILYVHTSNYRICGFTHTVSIEELSSLCQKYGIYLLVDAGSGALIDYSKWWEIEDEPIIPNCIKKGADIVTFSGDKLLGSCQAGLIVGKEELIKKIRKNPLARALRIDKFTLSILETTLKAYIYYKDDIEKLKEEIPVLKMLTYPLEELRKKAEIIKNNLKSLKNSIVKVIETKSQAGSGSFPTLEIPSYGVVFKVKDIKANKLAKLLRLNYPSVFVRIKDDFILIDVRTLQEGEEILIAEIIAKIINQYNK